MINQNDIEDVKYEYIEDPIDGQPLFAEPIDNENFGEVLELTEWSDSSNNSSSTAISNYVDIEYNDIDLVTITKKQENLAKSFVSKVEKFILNYDNGNITPDQKQYLNTVAKLELNKLSDLLMLTEVNKMLLDNMIRRINSVQGEDYAMIQTYNTLVNQHLKLHREVSIAYKSVPSTIKKLQAEVIGDLPQISNEPINDNAIITKDFGTSQFNNSKQMLKNLEEQKRLKLEQQQNKIT